MSETKSSWKAEHRDWRQDDASRSDANSDTARGSCNIHSASFKFMLCGFTELHLIVLLPSLLAYNATSCMLNYNVQDQDTNQYDTVQQLCGGYYYDIYRHYLLTSDSKTTVAFSKTSKSLLLAPAPPLFDSDRECERTSFASPISRVHKTCAGFLLDGKFHFTMLAPSFCMKSLLK